MPDSQYQDYKTVDYSLCTAALFQLQRDYNVRLYGTATMIHGSVRVTLCDTLGNNLYGNIEIHLPRGFMTCLLIRAPLSWT
jgi:hypothetical protein